MGAISLFRIIRVYSGSLRGLPLLIIAFVIGVLRAIFNRLYYPLSEICRALLRKVFINSLVYSRDNLWFVIPNYREAFIAEISLHEPLTYRVLSRVVNKLKRLGRRILFIDVGAHIGTYTIRFARKSVDVVAVEPSPLALAYLKVNLKLNNVEDRVKIVPFVAYSRHGIVKLQQALELGWFRVSDEADRGLAVEALSLDDLYENTIEYENYDIIIAKVDVEGAELEVLKGMKRMLEDRRVIVAVEIMPENYEGAKALLSAYGRRVILIETLNYLILPLIGVW